MGLVLTIIGLWILYLLARAFRPAVAVTGMKTHKQLHPTHRVETYRTPRGATIFHCWGEHGGDCGERWKVRAGVELPERVLR